ncbi:MAG: DUF3846 domain-containing protein [Ruminiclostridium sp.]
MKVVMVDPGKPAYVTEIGNDLHSLQKAVGGLIETLPFLEDAVMVANEEAKLIGLKGNRRFSSSIVAGSFFICAEKETEEGYAFCDLPDELCEKYIKQFAVPEEIPDEETEQDISFGIFAI